MKVYLAHAMTGRTPEEVLAEGRVATQVLAQYGITAVDPAAEETFSPGKPIDAPKAKVVGYWDRDKTLIRQCHVVLDLTGRAKSEGSAHEVGYARYFLWKPVARIYPGLPAGSVAGIEDDLVCGSLEYAASMIHYLWGTRRKRLLWKFAQYKRCRARALWYEILEWVNLLKE